MAKADRAPVEVVELKHISDADADEIARWMTEAFYKSDDGPILYTGRTFEEDPEAHRLLFRAVIDRGSICGHLLTTSDRKAHRIQFLPGEKNRILDTTWRSGNDAAWDTLIDRLGGLETFGPYIKKAMEPFSRTLRATYGESEGIEHVRSMLFGVKPGCQGRGIGRAMQEYTMREAEKANARFFFCTNTANLPLYEALGCSKVAQVEGGLPAQPGYPEGANQYVYVEAHWPRP